MCKKHTCHGLVRGIVNTSSTMKTKSLAQLMGMLGKTSLFLLGRESFLDACNNTSLSEGQLNGLSLDMCIEEAIEKKNPC